MFNVEEHYYRPANSSWLLCFAASFYCNNYKKASTYRSMIKLCYWSVAQYLSDDQVLFCIFLVGLLDSSLHPVILLQLTKQKWRQNILYAENHTIKRQSWKRKCVVRWRWRQMHLQHTDKYSTDQHPKLTDCAALNLILYYKCSLSQHWYA